jgi:hypothetical protein
VELVYIVMVLEREVVASFVSNWEGFVYSVETVEWLMNISKEMDEESESN